MLVIGSPVPANSLQALSLEPRDGAAIIDDFNNPSTSTSSGSSSGSTQQQSSSQSSSGHYDGVSSGVSNPNPADEHPETPGEEDPGVMYLYADDCGKKGRRGLGRRCGG